MSDGGVCSISPVMPYIHNGCPNSRLELSSLPTWWDHPCTSWPTQVYLPNTTRILPYMYHPYMHVFCICICLVGTDPWAWEPISIFREKIVRMQCPRVGVSRAGTHIDGGTGPYKIHFPSWYFTEQILRTYNCLWLQVTWLIQTYQMINCGF